LTGRSRRHGFLREVEFPLPDSLPEKHAA